ncbi:MAG: hypothetical protein WC378_18630, partial [Opitutaceae bacterium]
PVVSLRGDRHASRVGSSLLTAAGHPEWIAHDESEYIAKAVELAADRTKLAGLRQQLRSQMQASLILDSKTQAANLGRALRQMWQAWCAGQNQAT